MSSKNTTPGARRTVTKATDAESPTNAPEQLDGESDGAFAGRVSATEDAARAAANLDAGHAERAEAEFRLKTLSTSLQETEARALATAAAVRVEAEKLAQLDMVDVIVPKAFNLTLDTFEVKHYADGTYRMPRAHAEHPYAKVNGVKLYNAK